MCLESALSGRLAYFSRLALEVMPRALSVDRKKRLSPVYIGDRASNPNSEIELQ